MTSPPPSSRARWSVGQLESVATTGIDLLKVSDLEECVSL